MKNIIQKALQKVTGLETAQVDVPAKDSFGDYSSNIAMQIKTDDKRPMTNDKESQKLSVKSLSPRLIAEDMKLKLESDKSLMEVVDKIDVAGPGFINFWIKKEKLAEELQLVLQKTEEYGKHHNPNSMKIMVEFAHPNTHKAFHIGHLRNITTGESLVRLMEANGDSIIRANYQGDVGPHIAKALWGIKDLNEEFPIDTRARADYLGKAYAHGNTAYEENEKAKEEIETINKLLYEKDENEWTELYRETRQWSLDYFDLIYKRVYSHFDRFYFESDSAPVGIEMARKAKEQGILVDGENGSIVFPGEKYRLHTRVFITGRGTPTYECKDLGLAKLQIEEHNPDKIVHIVANEQKAYFEVVFKALEEILPESKGKEVHAIYGFVQLKDGKMSSRKGNVILGETLLDEAKAAIIKEYGTDPQIAEMIAVAAIKYSFLKVGTGQDIAFDLKESIALDGNSGPYLQYTYARTNSVLEKSESSLRGAQGDEAISRDESISVRDCHAGARDDMQLNEEELSVLRLLPKFSEVIHASAQNYSPNLLCNYLYDLAQRYNGFYNKHRILEAENGTREFRLALTKATGTVLKNGLNLLGIEAPGKM